jgi:cell division protein FtsA
MVILKKNIFSIVEFGSSKITCAICQFSSEHIKILGIGSEIAYGIKNGAPSNIKDVINSIIRAISKAESQYGKTIDDIYVVLSGASIESEVINQEILFNGGREVSDKDIKNLISKAHESLNQSDNRSILHSINNGYGLDGLYVSNPRGMYASRIDSSTNFISATRIPLLNINQVFAQSHTSVKSYIAAPYADTFSCLNDDDKAIGATVVNFGAQNTSVATFKNGCLTSCYSKPIGGSYITLDIAYAFGVSMSCAEKMKLLHGSLFLDENSDEKISMQIDDETEEEILVNKNDFLSVIIARQEEIIESMFQKNGDFSYDISERKIIITGGAHKITGLTDMISQIFPCKIVKSMELHNIHNFENEFKEFHLHEPENSSILGAIKYLHHSTHDQLLNFDKSNSKSSSKLKKLFAWAR